MYFTGLFPILNHTLFDIYYCPLYARPCNNHYRAQNDE